jgi:hypothetical protein
LRGLSTRLLILRISVLGAEGLEGEGGVEDAEDVVWSPPVTALFMVFLMEVRIPAFFDFGNTTDSEGERGTTEDESSDKVLALDPNLVCTPLRIILGLLLVRFCLRSKRLVVEEEEDALVVSCPRLLNMFFITLLPFWFDLSCLPLLIPLVMLSLGALSKNGVNA